MKLWPLDTPERIELAGRWLTDEQNYKWLDFGNGVQRLDPIAIKIMVQRDIHILRIYTAEDDETPVGIAGLSDVHLGFKTATAWCVLGQKRYGGLSARGVSKLLTLGFDEIGLEAVNAWTLENNRGGLGVIEQLGFKYIGRQRRCHHLNGQAYDRLWFDLLKSEHKEI